MRRVLSFADLVTGPLEAVVLRHIVSMKYGGIVIKAFVD